MRQTNRGCGRKQEMLANVGFEIFFTSSSFFNPPVSVTVIHQSAFAPFALQMHRGEHWRRTINPQRTRTGPGKNSATDNDCGCTSPSITSIAPPDQGGTTTVPKCPSTLADTLHIFFDAVFTALTQRRVLTVTSSRSTPTVCCGRCL